MVSNESITKLTECMVKLSDKLDELEKRIKNLESKNDNGLVEVYKNIDLLNNDLGDGEQKPLPKLDASHRFVNGIIYEVNIKNNSAKVICPSCLTEHEFHWNLGSVVLTECCICHTKFKLIPEKLQHINGDC